VASSEAALYRLRILLHNDVSTAVAQRLGEQFQFEERSPIRVKGIQIELEIRVVTGRMESDR
jgi:hypothetical protein